MNDANQIIKYSIIIPTYNSLEDCLKPCLDSLMGKTSFEETEVIVIANGHNKKTKEYLKSIKEDRIKVLWADEALGFAKACNYGIDKSVGEYIILLNDDLVLLDWQGTNDWIRMLEHPFKEDEKMAITGPAWGGETYGGKSFIVFFCAMIKKNIFSHIGLLNENFGISGGEDIEFCLKALQENYHIRQVPEATNHHEANGGFPVWHKAVGLTKIKNEDFIRNIKILESCWGKRNPTFEKAGLVSSIRSVDETIYFDVIVNNEYWINEEDMWGKNVLDIGANIGTFVLMAARHGAKRIVAIEPFKKNYEKLFEHFGDDPRVLMLNLAVTDGTTENIYLEGEGIFVHSSKNNCGPSIKTITLSSCLQFFDRDDNNLVLKLDCEGAEYEILFSANTEDILRFETIYIEIHKGYGDHDRLCDYLKNLGYERITSRWVISHETDELQTSTNIFKRPIREHFS